jgi:hypothetical protein
MKDLIKKEDAGEPPYTESAYSSESIVTFCKSMGVGTSISQERFLKARG